MGLSLGIEFAVGFSILLISLSCLIHASSWMEWFARVSASGNAGALALGAGALFICTLVVGLHPIWQGLPILVTLVGVVGIIESSLYLFFPAALSPLWRPFIRSRRLVRLGGFIMLLLSLLILYGWYIQIS